MSSSDSVSQDSPLSITASVTGILTFVVAIAAAIYVRLTYLRNADQEYFQVKSSLSWFKTESTWMSDLINATDKYRHRNENEKEYQMYEFIMDQLVKLEERLLAMLVEAELEANRIQGSSRSWTLIPQKYRIFKFPTATAIAVSWWPIRTKALELVRQREALGSRVLFAQLSMISSHILDQESRIREQEEHVRDRLDLLEGVVQSHVEKLAVLSR